MITTQTLWGLTGALTLMLIIAIALAYRAYGVDQRAASDASARQIDTLRKNLRAAQLQRDSISTQLEDNKRTAAETIGGLQSQHNVFQGALIAADSAIGNCRIELDAERARADSFASTSVSPMEAQLVRQMAEKLQLASAAMHATQQFKAAREAKELALRGNRLADRLEGRHQEAAA